jgi:hypothetical protein
LSTVYDAIGAASTAESNAKSYADTNFVNVSDLPGQLSDYVLLTEKGQALGVATLDADGQVPAEQLGNVPAAYVTSVGDFLSVNAGELTVDYSSILQEGGEHHASTVALGSGSTLSGTWTTAGKISTAKASVDIASPHLFVVNGRASKLIVSAVHGDNIHVSEFILAIDGSNNVHITEYGTVASGSDLFTLSIGSAGSWGVYANINVANDSTAVTLNYNGLY